MLEVNRTEEEVLRYWKENKTLEQLRQRNKGAKKFYFLDGPPFVTGNLHPGQMWVKTNKDIILRYKRFRGFDVHDNAGYDVHGLPIEIKVEQQLGVKSKREIETVFGIETFVQSCKEYITSYMGRMDADYERFGMTMDFAHPYIPSDKGYMAAVWHFIKTVSDKGYLYKGKRPMAYCPRCGTALSQGSMEVVYADEKDPSIFVAFKTDKPASKKAKIVLDDNTYLLIWTTTPWTIPANMAVAANPKEMYVKARLGNKTLILGKSRLDAVSHVLGESAVVEAEFYGSELEGVAYIHPLEAKIPRQGEYRNYHKVILSELLVSASEGSGFVHSAPGHGLDDFNEGRKYGLPAFSIVDEDGKYTGDAGEYAGLDVPAQANDRVLQDLAQAGALLHNGSLTHSYPHCWRCKTKLIYMATDQWFINIQKVKNKIIKQSAKVGWHPADAKGWQEDVLRTSPDWCVSRQRYWGTPMPIWECRSCKANTVIGSLEELREKAINKEEVDKLTDLHRPYVDKISLKCDKCGDWMSRLKDIIDVWVDSAVAFRASLSEDEFNRLFPVDFILEGHDQFRGWFSSQLKMGVLAYGKSPFKHCGVDGFLLAEKGVEMHKSLGNYVGMDEILKSYASADGFRMWCSGHTPWLDMLFTKADMKEGEKVVLTMYNMANLFKEYTDAIDYAPKKVKKPRALEKLELEDAWMTSRLNRLIKTVTDGFDNYEMYKSVNAIHDFVLNDLSRFYLKLAKKKILYSSRKEARATVNLLHYVLYNLLVLMSPVTPFLSERVYLDLFGTQKSVLFEKWPKANMRLVRDALDAEFDVADGAITAILNSREKEGMRLRQPLARATVEVNSDAAFDTLQKLAYVVEEYANLKHLDVKKVEAFNVEIKPNFAKLGPDFKNKSAAVAEALKGADAKELRKAVESSGHYPLHTNAGLVDVKSEHFTIVETVKNEAAVPFKQGVAYVDKELSNELREEAMVREFEHRVQMARKQKQLKKADAADVEYEINIGYASIINKNKKRIMKSVNAKSLKEGISSLTDAMDFEIDEDKLRLVVKRVYKA